MAKFMTDDRKAETKELSSKPLVKKGVQTDITRKTNSNRNVANPRGFRERELREYAPDAPEKKVENESTVKVINEKDIDSVDPDALKPKSGREGILPERLSTKSMDDKKSEFNQVSFKKAFDQLSSQIKELSNSIESIKEDITADVLKIISDQSDGKKTGKPLKRDLNIESDTKVVVKINMKESDVKYLNDKVDELKKAGRTRSRDQYLRQIVLDDLGL